MISGDFKVAKKIFFLSVCVIFVFLLMSYPESSVNAVRGGLYYFGSVLIPSIFPITLITSLIMKIAAPKSRKQSMTAIFFFSLTGGYIIGAKLIKDALESQRITKRQGRFLSLFCVNGGIGFIVSAVGVGIFGQIKAGLLLYLCNILYSIAGFLIFFPKEKETGGYKIRKTEKPFSVLFCDTVSETAGVMIKIGGFVLLFSAVNSCLENIGAGFLSDLFEITTAVNKAHSLPVLSLLIGFSGISVIFQILSVIGDIVDLKLFLLSRAAHALFSFAAMYLLTKFVNVALPVSAASRISVSPFYDSLSVSVFSVITVIMLILSLEGKNRGGNLSEDLLK